MLCDAFVKAGLPEGVVNMVFGYGASIGNDLVTHQDISLISFTGNYLVYLIQDLNYHREKYFFIFERRNCDWQQNKKFHCESGQQEALIGAGR